MPLLLPASLFPPAVPQNVRSRVVITNAEKGLYCSDHTCRKNGCLSLAELSKGSDFCTAHTCADPDCTNEAEEDNGFCPEHIPLAEEPGKSDNTETEPTKDATDDTIPEKKSSKGYSGMAPRWKPSYSGDNDKTDNVTVTPKPTAIPTSTPKPTSTPAPTPKNTPIPTKKPVTKQSKDDDPYDAKDYVHPDDFYYDYFDDFIDYEEAEEYWENNQ